MFSELTLSYLGGNWHYDYNPQKLNIKVQVKEFHIKSSLYFPHRTNPHRGVSATKTQIYVKFSSECVELMYDPRLSVDVT